MSFQSISFSINRNINYSLRIAVLLIMIRIFLSNNPIFITVCIKIQNKKCVTTLSIYEIIIDTKRLLKCILHLLNDKGCSVKVMSKGHYFYYI